MLHITFTLYASRLTLTSGGGVIAEIKAGETARVTPLDVFSSAPPLSVCTTKENICLFVFTPLRREHMKKSQDRC